MPGVGPPMDARAVGGAALSHENSEAFFPCLLLTLQNPESEGFGGGIARLPKYGRGPNTKISGKPRMLVIACIFLSTKSFQAPSVVIIGLNGTGPGMSRAQRIWPTETSGLSDYQTFNIFQHISTLTGSEIWKWPMPQTLLGLDLLAVQICRECLALAP